MKLTEAIRTTKHTIWWGLVLLWVARYVQGFLLHQLQDAPFVDVEADNFFWLWHGLYFVQWSIHNYWLAVGLDIGWLVLAIIGMAGKNRWWSKFLFVLIFINYFVCYNSVATHHEHTLIGFLFLLPLLVIKKPTNFVLSFASLRYYVLFAMSSAGIWKLSRGGAFVSGQMSEILKRQHIDYLISYPDNTYTHFIQFLINNIQIADIIWWTALSIELFFLIGFLTKRLDGLLGYLFLLFFVGDYLIMDINFIEFCIFAIVFFPPPGIWKRYDELRHDELRHDELRSESGDSSYEKPSEDLNTDIAQA